MGDLIDRQAAVDALKAQADTMRTWSERYAEQRRGILTAVNIVEDIKPADVVPVVHGRWEHGKCNLCGEHAPYWCLATTYHESMYCPNCGAKMEGGENT